MSKRVKLIIFLLPLIIFLAIGLFFWRGLSMNPRLLPSALLNKPVPAFQLPSLLHPQQKLSDKLFQGHVSLVNVWATWCAVCADEYPILVGIAYQNVVPIYGLDYKDNRAHALAWIKKYGNPFKAIGFDKTGSVAINWGVYGTPETFVIDKHGVIRYKQVGPITNKIWQNKLLPLVEKLKRES